MSEPDLLVIGGGIAGMSTALFSARNGHDVALFEKRQLGSGATNAAAGVLIPPSFLDRSKPEESQNSFALLSEKGYQFYPDFIDLLDEYSMFETGFSVSGTWHLATSEDQRASLKNYCEEMKRFDRDVDWTEGREIRDQYDPLSENVLGGYFYAEEAQVDPGRLTQALHDALRSENVELHEGEPILDLEFTDGGRCDQVQSENGTYHAGQVVIAAGCWSQEFESRINQPIRVEPRKGQMVKFRENLGSGPMFEYDEIHVVPRMDGTVDVGATVENTGYDTEVTREARDQICQSASQVFPNLNARNVIDQWAGLRPYAQRKGGPFLGDIPETENVYINAGHYQKGILQAPYSGYLLAQLINGDQPDLDLSPYRVDR